jgi:hypothetical protein
MLRVEASAFHSDDQPLRSQLEAAARQPAAVAGVSYVIKH